MRLEDPGHTWHKNHEGGASSSKLDRIYISRSLLLRVRNAKLLVDLRDSDLFIVAIQISIKLGRLRWQLNQNALNDGRTRFKMESILEERGQICHIMKDIKRYSQGVCRIQHEARNLEEIGSSRI